QRGRSDRTADAGGGDRPVYSETVYPRQAFGWSALASWRSGRFLLVEAPRRGRYDLVADPPAPPHHAATRPRGPGGVGAGGGGGREVRDGKDQGSIRQSPNGWRRLDTSADRGVCR